MRKTARLLALDLFLVGENSAYEAQADANSGGRFVSLLYQPQAMRSRGITVLTNTPPRRAQSQPGGLQAIMVVEPVMAKAARQLGIDQVALRRINAPEGKAKLGPADAKGQRAYATSAFLKEALDRGKEVFRWDERKARSGKRNGSTVRGVGVAVSTFVAGSTGFDGLFVIRPDGRMYVQSGVGNLGTESVFDVHRVAAEMLGMPWDKVTVAWGDTAQPLPWTCVSGGSQTTHAMTRAAHAAASDAIAKAREIAAAALGGSPESYQVAGERVFSGGRSMTLAEVARRAIEMAGKYDGHELPDNINPVTKTAAAAMAGQGLMGVARDTYPRDGGSYSFVAGFAEVEVDVETGHYQVLDYTAIGDSGTIIHPRAYGGQVLGRSVLGMSHALSLKTVYDQHYGLSMTQRFYQSRPPTTARRPAQHAVGGAEHPRSGDARRRSRHRRAAGGGWRLRDPERALGRARRRRLPARAGDDGQHPDGARTRAAHAGSAHRSHLRTGVTPWPSCTTSFRRSRSSSPPASTTRWSCWPPAVRKPGSSPAAWTPWTG